MHRKRLTSVRRTGGTIALAAALALPAGPAVALDGADGADGAGHDGTVGDAGGDGGAARTISAGTGDVSLGAGDADTGGDGGNGRALTAADARSTVSTTPGITNLPLAGQAGIAAGDSLDVTVNGVTQTITITATLTIFGLREEIRDRFPTLDVSTAGSGTNYTMTIAQGGTVIDSFTITNNNNTPLTALGFQGPFPRTIDPLFDNGGAGGDGAAAIVLDATSDDTLTNLGTIAGGDGGNGGDTIFRDGVGGAGGDGAAAIRVDAGSTAAIVNRGTIRGGDGGARGAGGVDGTAGTHGTGGAGITGAGMTITNGGTIAGGLAGDGTARANAISFTGGSNTLTLESGFTITGNVVADGGGDDTLAFGGTAAGSFDTSAIDAGGQYRNFGAIRKTGTGTWTFTGTGTYTGATTVDAGTLAVDGSLASTVTAGAGGTLGGTGTLGGGAVIDGTLAPGNSIGTLSVTGSLTFGAGSTYSVEVDAAGQSDRTNVTGTATLAGTVQAVPASGSYAYQSDYTILTATDPLAGSFDAVTSTSAFFDPSLIYGTNSVTLRMIRNNTEFADVGTTANQSAAGAALDAGAADGATGDLSVVLAALSGLSAGQAQAALTQLSGASLSGFAGPQLVGKARFDNAVRARAGGAGGSGSGGNSAFAGAGGDPVAALAPGVAEAAGPGTDGLAAMGNTLGEIGRALSAVPVQDGVGTGVWFSGYGVTGRTDGDANAGGSRYRVGGALAGYDWRHNREVTLGVVLGYSRSAWDQDNSDDEGEAESVSAGLYGTWRPAVLDGRLAVDGALGLGVSEYDSERHLVFGGIDRTAEGETDGYDISARTGVSYSIDRGAYKIVPSAGLGYVRLHRDGYTETGAGAAGLVVGATDTDSLKSRLGVEVARPMVGGGGTVWTPWVAGGWRHEFLDTAGTVDAAFVGVPDSAFRTEGVEAGRDTAEIGIGVRIATMDGTEWHARYGASLSESETSHGIYGGIRLRW